MHYTEHLKKIDKKPPPGLVHPLVRRNAPRPPEAEGLPQQRHATGYRDKAFLTQRRDHIIPDQVGEDEIGERHPRGTVCTLGGENRIE